MLNTNTLRLFYIKAATFSIDLFAFGGFKECLIHLLSSLNLRKTLAIICHPLVFRKHFSFLQAKGNNKQEGLLDLSKKVG